MKPHLDNLCVGYSGFLETVLTTHHFYCGSGENLFNKCILYVTGWLEHSEGLLHILVVTSP